MSNFTPGPWEAVKDNDFYGYSIVTKDNKVVASFIDNANARLIAAAPEMLDKLKAAIPYIKMSNEELDGGEGGFIMALLEETIALLRRIEGKEDQR